MKSLLISGRVAGSCKLQTVFSTTVCKHGSEEVHIVRGPVILKESEKGIIKMDVFGTGLKEGQRHVSVRRGVPEE